MYLKDLEYEALQEQYRRLRRAAQGVLDACAYPSTEDEERRVYESQLQELRRELAGEPQPTTRLTWMSPT